jgi:acetaldehyde dehydrogenase (acetylating)
VTEHISSIASKQTQTVTFSNLDLSKAFSSQAIVQVVVGKVKGETILTNNHQSYPVFFSLSSGG